MSVEDGHLRLRSRMHLPGRDGEQHELNQIPLQQWKFGSQA